MVVRVGQLHACDRERYHIRHLRHAVRLEREGESFDEIEGPACDFHRDVGRATAVSELSPRLDNPLRVAEYFVHVSSVVRGPQLDRIVPNPGEEVWVEAEV